MRTFSLILALILTTGCPGSELPTFGTFSPNELDTADTGDTGIDGQPLVIEGQSWLYDGTIPGEEEAGVACPEDGGTCERCFLAQNGKVTISFRPKGAQEWAEVEYASYTPAMGSDTAIVVDLKWNWNPTTDAGLPTPWLGYVVISAASGIEYTTLAIGTCPE